MMLLAHALPRLNLTLLQTFLLVTEERSFRAAAEAPFCSSSAVSTQRRQLWAQRAAAQ